MSVYGLQKSTFRPNEGSTLTFNGLGDIVVHLLLAAPRWAQDDSEHQPGSWRAWGGLHDWGQPVKVLVG